MNWAPPHLKYGQCAACGGLLTVDHVCTAPPVTVPPPLARGFDPTATNEVQITLNQYQLHNLLWLLNELAQDPEWLGAFNTGDWFGEIPSLLAEKAGCRDIRANATEGEARRRIAMQNPKRTP